MKSCHAIVLPNGAVLPIVSLSEVLWGGCVEPHQVADDEACAASANETISAMMNASDHAPGPDRRPIANIDLGGARRIDFELMPPRRRVS